MTQTPTTPKPLHRPPLCSGCEYEYRPPVPGTTRRFGVWQITRFDPECIEHHAVTHGTLAADLRFGD